MRAYFVSPALDGGVFMLEDPVTEALFDQWQNSVDEEERLGLDATGGAVYVRAVRHHAPWVSCSRSSASTPR